MCMHFYQMFVHVFVDSTCCYAHQSCYYHQAIAYNSINLSCWRQCFQYHCVNPFSQRYVYNALLKSVKQMLYLHLHTESEEMFGGDIQWEEVCCPYRTAHSHNWPRSSPDYSRKDIKLGDFSKQTPYICKMVMHYLFHLRLPFLNY